MPTFRFSLKFLFWYFGIFCTSETIKYTDSVIEYKCPLSRKPISFQDYHDSVKSSPDNSTEYWTDCLLPDYSCAKIKVPKLGHLFACIPDFGEIRPAFFDFFKPTGIHKVILEDYFSLAKGCSKIENDFTETTITTVTYRKLTFVTELSCCKGPECFGRNWEKIWDDNDYASGEFHPRDNIFWYTSISVTATLLSLFIGKSSFLGYQRLKEQLVLESLKTISRTLKEADDEDKITRRAAIANMFRIRRRKKKADVHCTDASSQKTDSVQALIRSNKK
ncbi:hypothetical protein L3Y34_001243 [Caenorhabditis briggsae]|uniref:Uncharacterized protein n=2 Tax=Caenorhabditis briggsae TaxID=6238 RepID=A0AAE9DBI8_CAEBR|nr:hypothetical protein L3Y34_001243 [Caenorhabditis briggsae]